MFTWVTNHHFVDVLMNVKIGSVFMFESPKIPLNLTEATSRTDKGGIISQTYTYTQK